MKQLLLNLSFRVKLIIFAGGLLSLTVGVGAFSSWIIRDQNEMAIHSVQNAQRLTELAVNARNAILEMDSAVSRLIASDDANEIRAFAVDSIRASSQLDEHSSKLSDALDTREVKRLSEVLEEIKPSKLKIIRFGRKNSDTEAMTVLNEISSFSAEIASLSEKILKDQQEHLNSELIEIKKRGNDLVVTIGIAIAVSLVVAILITLIVSSVFGRGLDSVKTAVRTLSEGNLNIDLPPHGNDEIGSTIAAVGDTANKLRKIIEKLHESSGMLSDESEHLSQASRAALNSNTVLKESVDRIMTEIDTISAATKSANAILECADKQADDTARSSSESCESIRDLVSSAKSFEKRMSETMEGAKDLSGIASEISKIASTIKGISEQTNLLALNASIESARAGDSGRGFAVVADEVRGLAARTSTATTEINELIDKVTENVTSVIEELDSAVKHSGQTVDLLSAVAEKSESASEASVQMRTEMSRVKEVMKEHEGSSLQISDAVRAMQALADESTASSEQLNEIAIKTEEASSGLLSLVKQFKV